MVHTVRYFIYKPNIKYNILSHRFGTSETIVLKYNSLLYYYYWCRNVRTRFGLARGVLYFYTAVKQIFISFCSNTHVRFSYVHTEFFFFIIITQFYVRTYACVHAFSTRIIKCKYTVKTGYDDFYYNNGRRAHKNRPGRRFV